MTLKPSLSIPFLALALALGFAALSHAQAAPKSGFNDKCPDIATCANVVGELIGQKYFFDPREVVGKVQGTGNLELTAETAEVLFTSMLHQMGFSRVPLGAPDTYQILKQRDARDSALPFVTADRDHPPALPQAWDLMTLKYQATHPEVVEDIARTSRSFMPANSRIIPVENTGTLLVTDSAPNLRKIYEIIKDMDRKLSPAGKRHQDEVQKRMQERSKSKAKDDHQ